MKNIGVSSTHFRWMIGFVFLFISACAATQKVDLQAPEGPCVFLGPDCARLKPSGKESGIGLLYINPAAKWTTYQKVMVDPITFWGDAKQNVSAEDAQELVNYFSTKLNTELAKHYSIVPKPEKGVLRVTLAITRADSSTPGMRNASVLIPQLKGLSTVSYALTGSYPFAGSAQAEGRLTDASSGETLWVGIDREIGAGSISNGVQGQWGDVKNAIDYWCETYVSRLYEFTSGKRAN